MMKIIITGLFMVFFTFALAGQNNNHVLHFGNPNASVYDICFSPKGETLFVAQENNINVYCVETQKLRAQFKNGHSKQIMSIDLSIDSSLLISGGKDSLFILWDIFNQTIIKKKSYHTGIVTSVKISPNKKYIASGATDNKVIVYDIQKDKIIYTFSDHKEDITTVDFNHEGNILVSSSGDGNIYLYNMKNGMLLSTLSKHNDWVRDVSFHPIKNQLISCGDDSKIIIWDIHRLDHIRSVEIKQGFNWLLSARFSANHEAYSVASFSGRVKIYTPHTELRYKIKGAINKVIFVPDETHLKIAMATRENGVIIIQAKHMKFKEL